MKLLLFSGGYDIVNQQLLSNDDEINIEENRSNKFTNVLR